MCIVVYSNFKFQSELYYFNGLSLWMHIFDSEVTWGHYSLRVTMELVNKQYVSAPTHTLRGSRGHNTPIQTQHVVDAAGIKAVHRK